MSATLHYRLRVFTKDGWRTRNVERFCASVEAATEAKEIVLNHFGVAAPTAAELALSKPRRPAAYLVSASVIPGD